MIKADIYNECCLKTMKRMENDSVDLVITSPPYNMNLRINHGRYCSRQIKKEFSTKYKDFNDNVPIYEYNEFHTAVLKELLRVADLVFYNVGIVTGSKRSIFKMIGEFSNFLKDIIVWDKGYAQPAMQKGVLNRQYELILVFERDYPVSRQFRKTARFERGALSDVWAIKRQRSISSKNKAVFPEALVEKILENFTKEGDTVYDPFLGTGTTGLVAKRMKRDFVGSEISKFQFEIAKKRIDELHRDKNQMDLKI